MPRGRHSAGPIMTTPVDPLGITLWPAYPNPAPVPLSRSVSDSAYTTPLSSRYRAEIAPWTFDYRQSGDFVDLSDQEMTEPFPGFQSTGEVQPMERIIRIIADYDVSRY